VANREIPTKNPHPNPPPEYKGRGEEEFRGEKKAGVATIDGHTLTH
jgi:hypothetical protein